MKRFWHAVQIVGTDRGFEIQLDGRTLKVPHGPALIAPSAPLAEAVAAEWQMAGDDFAPDQLPLTQLLSTALDRIPKHRANIVQQLAAYGMNDLLCYRANAPAALAALQSQSWDPWLKWLEQRHGIRLARTAGLVPIQQSAAEGDRILSLVGRFSDYMLAAFGVIVPALGSLVLGLALADGALTAEGAYVATSLDETWQEQQWGEDPDARDRRARIAAEVATTAYFMRLVEP